MTMQDHVARYVALRRRLGTKLVALERMLLDYAAYAAGCGDAFAQASGMLAWASAAGTPGEKRRRLGAVRSFALWLHAEDQRHEIPPRDAFGKMASRRPAPHLLTPAQIQQLMEAALQLPPAGSISPQTYRCLFGLMAATGLRRSEAVALRLDDLTPDGLVVCDSKFGKSRLVPLHPSTQDALAKYVVLRASHGGKDDHLFVLSTGRPPTPSTLTRAFIKVARQIGLRGEPGEPGPRLHDLRHAFACRSLEHAVATNPDGVNRHMLALSTYLGHARVADTQWYLEATPALLGQIARAAESAHERRTLP